MVDEQKQAEAKPEAKPEAQAEAKKEQEQPKEEAAKITLTKEQEEFVSKIENMKVLELSNLVKALEEKFGVSAQAPMMVAQAGGPGAGGAAPAEEEKTMFDVVLAEIGPNKIQVIKEIRAVTSLGLKEAKDLVEAAPKAVKEGLPKKEAEEMKTRLETTGAKVELK
ncbi:MAG: 50S ribosomal protein L7/L12 [Candidatus Omnitrophica bacterium]|nr:50S ribosomal protein L7/L12 [Candidatus Omnitrophota bacterium]